MSIDRSQITRLIALLLSLLTATSTTIGADTSGPTREKLDFFEAQVRPLLVEQPVRATPANNRISTALDSIDTFV